MSFVPTLKGIASEQVRQSVTAGKFEGGMNVGPQRELVRSEARTKGFWFRRPADVFCDAARFEFYRRNLCSYNLEGNVGTLSEIGFNAYLPILEYLSKI